VLGAELEANATWARHARSSLSLTLLDPRDTTVGRTLTNDLLPYQSRLVSSLFLEGFVEPRARVVKRVSVDARLSYRGSRLADPAGLIVLPASTELDLGAALVVLHELSVRCAVDDVLDAHRFDFIGYPVPGRSVHAALEAWW
jgi:iron complex outermembrane receptor protein